MRWFVLILVFILPVTYAGPFKCAVDGKTVYQAAPCLGSPGKEIVIEPYSHVDAEQDKLRAEFEETRELPTDNEAVKALKTELFNSRRSDLEFKRKLERDRLSMRARSYN